jgi:hypothetical protein
MRDKVYFFVDASNYAYTKPNPASLVDLFSARDSLIRALDGRPHQIVLIADSWLHKHFREPYLTRYNKLTANGEITLAASTHNADLEIVKLARKHDGHAISADGYRENKYVDVKEWANHLEWLDSPGKARLIGGLKDPVDGSWEFSERRFSEKKNVGYRSLREVLDDLYPTTRSVFRELGLSTDQIKDFSAYLDLSVPEIAIISKDDAERIRKIVGQLLEYRTNLRSLFDGSSVSEQDGLQWLTLSGYSTFQRDGDYYVSHDVATKVENWLTGQFPTLSAFRLKLAIDNRDVEGVRRLVNDLDFEGQEKLALFGRTWVNLADGSTAIDWKAIESLDSLFLTFLVEEAIERNLIDEGFNLSANRIAKLSPPLNNRLLANRYRASNNIDDVIAFYSSYVGHIEEDRKLQKEAGQWIIDAAFDEKHKWSKRKWKMLSDAVSRSALYSPEHVVSYYFSGNHERALTGMYTSDKKLTNRLRLHYLNEIVAMPWMSPDDLGLFLLNSVLRNHLIAGDYESFLASEEVIDTAVRNIDRLGHLESQWSNLVFARAVELQLRPLCLSIVNAIDVLDKFTFESRS